jgi:hypothetical protein
MRVSRRVWTTGLHSRGRRCFHEQQTLDPDFAQNALDGMGAKLGDLASSSVYDKFNVSDKYSDYVFVVLAMAFTDEADEFLRGVGMEPIPGAEAPVASLKTVKMYREDFKVGSRGLNFAIADFVSANWTGSESR